VEGHVPADLIVRLLRERPNVVGLAVPRMPAGSPGMDAPGRSAGLAGLRDHGLAVGCVADLVVLEARSLPEAAVGTSVTQAEGIPTS
jgi:hypothetical protein